MKNKQLNYYDDGMLKIYIENRRKQIQDYHNHIKALSEELDEALWLKSQRLAKKLEIKKI